MADNVTDRLASTFDRTEDLATGLSDQAMNQRLAEPSNTVWEQLWCVVGARESYAKAIEAGAWVGFECSLTAADRGSKSKVIDALQASRSAVDEAVASSRFSREMVLDLLLHETQHHGQLIRYVYGLGLDFPQSWRDRWNL
jgi:hypothetical protein